MPELTFEGNADWKSGTECDLTVKGEAYCRGQSSALFWRERRLLCSGRDLRSIVSIVHEHVIHPDRQKLQLGTEET